MCCTVHGEPVCVVLCMVSQCVLCMVSQCVLCMVSQCVLYLLSCPDHTPLWGVVWARDYVVLCMVNQCVFYCAW